MAAGVRSSLPSLAGMMIKGFKKFVGRLKSIFENPDFVCALVIVIGVATGCLLWTVWSLPLSLDKRLGGLIDTGAFFALCAWEDRPTLFAHTVFYVMSVYFIVFPPRGGRPRPFSSSSEKCTFSNFYGGVEALLRKGSQGRLGVEEWLG